MEPVNFIELEERISRLLSSYSALQDEKKRLEEELRQRNAGTKELEDLREKVKRLEKEKGVVKEKVSGLIQRLDGLIQSV
ncbi:MAG TPA: cell division protein ZapB [Thermodesulfobacteriota bacterium]|nr:cell division protein ZapB [Thermodesulfobacteriota bacterium]